MKEIINKWIWLDLLYYKDEFQEINKLNFVHPLDQEKFKGNPMTTLYKCIGFEDDFLIIKNRTHSFRVKVDAIKRVMPTPRFSWNDKVVQVSKPETEGKIDDLFWHHKDQKYLYHLSVLGKINSKRYDESDLRKVG